MFTGIGRLLVGDAPNEHPGDQRFRTGFVLSRDHVLTAASCVHGLADEPLWLRLSGDPADSHLAERRLVPVRVTDVDEALDGALLVVDPSRLPDGAGPRDELLDFLDRVALTLNTDAPTDLPADAGDFVASETLGGATATGLSAHDPDQGLWTARAVQQHLRATVRGTPGAPPPYGDGVQPTATSLDDPTSETAAETDERTAAGAVRLRPRAEAVGWSSATVFAARFDDLARRFGPVADAVATAAQRRLDARAAARCGDAAARPLVPVSVPPAVGSGSLVRLLQAEAALTTFRGRVGERAQLRDWCVSPAPRSGWVMVGAGGAGKTRLAAELTSELAASGGWLTGLVHGPGDLETVRAASAAAAVSGRGLLLAVDGADEYGLDAWVPLIDLLAGSPARWRLLLLARTAGDWWTDATIGVRGWLEDAAAEIPSAALDLGPLEPTEQGRRAAFGAIVDALRAPVAAFASEHGLPFVPGPPAPPLVDPAFGCALMLHVAAVCALLPEADGRAGDDAAAAAGPRTADLLGRVLDLECRHRWLGLSGDGPEHLVAGSREWRMAERAVATATLFGAATEGEATTVLAAALALDDADWIVEAARWLHDLYPDGELGDSWLPALRPSLLGEELVARVIRAEIEDRRLPLTRTLPYRVLTDGWPCPATAEQVQRMLTVLTRAAARHDHLSHVLGVATSPLLDRVPTSYDLTLVEAALPAPEANVLGFGTHLARWLLDLRVDGEGSPAPGTPLGYPQAARRARLQHNLAVRLSRAGRRVEALAPAQDAVDLYRRLAAHRPSLYLPRLATARNNLAAFLSGLGRHEEALVPAQEAVDLYRQLAADTPNAHRASLAGSLTNLGAVLSAVGRRTLALGPAQEAVDLYRELAADAPRAHLPHLAGSLTNLATVMSGAGRRDAALKPAQEAVDLYHQLAADTPDTHLSNLAASLTNLVNRLAEVGRDGDMAVSQVIADFPLPAGRAFLLTRRAGIAARPHARRTIDAIVALDCARGADAPAILAEVRQTLRALRDEDQAAFDQAWSQRYPDPPPTGLTLTDTVPHQAVDWLDCPTSELSAARPGDPHDSFAPDGLDAFDEPSPAFPDGSEIDARRQLLAATAESGIDDAYATALAAEVLQAWIATSTWQDSRAFLDEHRTTLLGESARTVLEAMLDADPAEPVLTKHRYLLAVAATGRADDAYARLAGDDDQRELHAC